MSTFETFSGFSSLFDGGSRDSEIHLMGDNHYLVATQRQSMKRTLPRQGRHQTGVEVDIDVDAVIMIVKAILTCWLD